MGRTDRVRESSCRIMKENASGGGEAGIRNRPAVKGMGLAVKTGPQRGRAARGAGLVARITTEGDMRVFTCSLLSAGYRRVENALFPALREAGRKLVVPVRVVQELYRFADDVTHQAHDGACCALRSLGTRRREGLVDLRGEPQDNFADNVFYVQFSRYRMHHPLVLITQDRALTADILRLNGVGSRTQAFRVSVYRITEQGDFEERLPGAGGMVLPGRRHGSAGGIRRPGEAS